MNNLLLVIIAILTNLFTTPTWSKNSNYNKDSLQIFEYFNTINSKPNIDSILLEKARIISNKDNDLKHLFDINYAQMYIIKGQLKHADSILNLSINKFSNTDSLHHILATCYNLKGVVYAYKGKQEQAIKLMTKALKIYEYNGMIKQSSTLNVNIANMFLSRNSYNQAYEYSKKAVKGLRKINDSNYICLALGIAAISSSELGEWKNTKKYANEGLKISNIKNNIKGICTANYALSELAYYNKKYNKSLSYSNISLELAIKIKDYTLIIGNNIIMLKNNLALENYTQALEYSNKAFELANKVNNKDVLYSLYKETAKINNALGNEKLAFKQMQKAEELYKEKVNNKNQKVINDLLIKYETEKKNNKIITQEKNITQQQNLIIILISFIIIATLIGIGIIRNTKQKQKLLKQNMKIEIAEAIAEGEEQERNRISGELHDGTASNLVALKFMIKKDNQKAINLLNKTHKEVRTIAHRLAPINFNNTTLAQEIETFCNLCKTDKTSIKFVSNTKPINISNNKQQYIYRIFQELIQNSLKHANATKIFVQLISEKNYCNLVVEDNGKGFDTSILENNKGLSSLKRRIYSINGELNIDSKPNKGTSVFVKINIL